MTSRPDGPVDLLIAPRVRPVGDGEVDRLLPYRLRRTVGPFTYLDLIGPEDLAPETGIDVPPHPHIGLATVTYLLEGAIVHRDSTGAVQRIEPGAVNWMHAGGGVVHSERSPDDERSRASRLRGAQLWVALPADAEDDAATFAHHPAASLPEARIGDATVRVLAGEAHGHRAPARVASPLHLVDVRLDGPGTLPAVDAPERGVLVLEGDVAVSGPGGTAVAVPPRHLAVLAPGPARIEARGPARALLLGGDPIGPRTIWWNFVATDPARIDEAKRRWRTGGFPDVPGETGRVPLPGAG